MSTSSNFQKIFSSNDLGYALRQAETNGYRILSQDKAMQAIAGESPVTVVEFKKATTAKTNYAGKTILGQLTLEQTRTVTIDPRTQEERMLGVNGSAVKTFKKKLLLFMQVTEAGMASLLPGHALSRDFYILEVITFSKVWEGHYGITNSNERVKRFSTKFLCSTAGNKPRESDRLILNVEEHEVLTDKSRGRKVMFDVIRERQLESGDLTLKELEAADAKAANNKVDEEPAPVDHVDEETGEVLTPAGGVASNGFGRGQQDDDNDLPF